MGWRRTMAGAACAWATAVAAQPAPDAALAEGDTAVVDYAKPAAWICLPGAATAQGAADGTCGGDLAAVAVTAAGARSPAPFPVAKAPPVDCFYVYPTTSDDPTEFSDLTVDASEKDTVHAQAARLATGCRLFVPAYHQVTLPALRWHMAHPGGPDTVGRILTVPYRDIRDAWRSYLKHDNHGRGVVLVGHSQGSILLKRLIRDEVDGKPAQTLLVAAYLAGNPDLGQDSFPHIPACRAQGQTGCVVAWSSYAADYAGPRQFGGSKEGAPLCVNPAALTGGRGMLKAVFPRPKMAPANDPPYVETIGQLGGACVTDANGAVLRVTVEPGRYADLLRADLAAHTRLPTWGLHGLDMTLVQGDLVDLLATQGAAWAKRTR